MTEGLDLLPDLQGHREVAQLSFETVCVHADVPGEMNCAPRIRFAFTPRKAF